MYTSCRKEIKIEQSSELLFSYYMFLRVPTHGFEITIVSAKAGNIRLLSSTVRWERPKVAPKISEVGARRRRVRARKSSSSLRRRKGLTKHGKSKNRRAAFPILFTLGQYMHRRGGAARVSSQAL